MGSSLESRTQEGRIGSHVFRVTLLGNPNAGKTTLFNALTGLSQKVAPQREPVRAGAAGHACGHSGLGTGALGAGQSLIASSEKISPS